VPLPDFLRIGTDDALAEFQSFSAAHRSAAANELALLTTLRTVGLSAIPSNHGINGLSRLRCIQTSGWAIFYVATGVMWKRAQDPAPSVCVVLVEQMTRAFSQISADAQTRVTAAGL
jgi:hypothetical protein